MDHRDLENFLALADSLHYGRTAAVRHMSTSALTRSIQRLESDLGHPLFVRDRRSVTLTAAGHRVRQFAQHQIDEVERLQHELATEHESPRGELRIACTVTACLSILPRMLARCRSSYPGITLRLVTQDAARSLQQLEAGEVDVAVMPIEDEDADGDLRLALTRTELVFIGPSRSSELEGRLQITPLPWGEIPLVAPSRGLERERLDAWLSDHELTPRIYAEVDGNEAMISMVAMGGGVALVPELVLAASPLKRKVKTLPEVGPQGYTVGLCTTARARRRRVVDVFFSLAM